MKVQTWFQVLFVFCIFQEMKDFDGQRGIVQKVLAASVRVTMLSGLVAGSSKTFPFQNVSKAMPKDKEGTQRPTKRSAESCSDEESATKKTAHGDANSGD
jgi:hypothetical protein